MCNEHVWHGTGTSGCMLVCSVHVFFLCTSTCSLTPRLSAHEHIFQLLRPSKFFPDTFDEIGDDPHARMIPLCGTVSAFPMGIAHTVKLGDDDPLRFAFWVLLEVITVPRAQCGLAGRANALPPLVLPTAIAWRARASTRTSHCHQEQ